MGRGARLTSRDADALGKTLSESRGRALFGSAPVNDHNIWTNAFGDACAHRLFHVFLNRDFQISRGRECG
jgi:hypothetical protein